MIGLAALGLAAGAAWWALRDRPVAATPTPQPLEPGRAEAALLLAEALQKQEARQPQEALRLFQQVLLLNPALKGVRYQMAVAAYQAGDETEATRHARTCLEHQESVPDARILLGTIAGRAGRHQDAAREFSAAVEADPANAMALYGWSESLRSQGRTAEAVEKLTQAVSRNPGEPLYALKLRLARIESRDDLPGLTEEIQRELSLDPPAGDWILTAAALDLAEGRKEAAARRLEQARFAMQPALFLGVVQEDPFFRKYRREAFMQPFLQAKIQIRTNAPATGPAGP